MQASQGILTVEIGIFVTLGFQSLHPLLGAGDELAPFTELDSFRWTGLGAGWLLAYC